MSPRRLPADSADAIFHHGKIAVVDDKFTVAGALAVKDGRVLLVGSDEEASKARPYTKREDGGPAHL